MRRWGCPTSRCGNGAGRRASCRRGRGVGVVVEDPAAASPGPDASLALRIRLTDGSAKATAGGLAERKAELDAALTEVAWLRDELRAIAARMAAADRGAEAAEKRAAFAEQRLLASLSAHPH